MDSNPYDKLIIETNGLTFAYNKTPVLQRVDLQVPAGSIFGFLGPNGAGKSTTIKTLLGLLKVNPGMAHIFGKELNNNRLEILRHIGSTIESPSLYEHLSARHNVEITQRLRGIAVSRIDEVIEIAGLTSDSDRLVRQFSTGMKQRLSLALALLGKPELLLLDEPINGLDPEGIREIRNLLVKLNREQGCTIFLSSHILDEVEKICSHVAVIHLGRIVYQGSTADLRQTEGTGGLLTLETSDNRRCLQLLPGANNGDSTGGQVSVNYKTRQDVADIIRKVVEAGIEIYSAKPEIHRLEESFFKLLKQGSET